MAARRLYDCTSLPGRRNYLSPLKLHGSLIDNLESALVSARRLRARPVYKDLLSYWAELVQEARRACQDPACVRSDELGAAIVKLEIELAERPMTRRATHSFITTA